MRLRLAILAALALAIVGCTKERASERSGADEAAPAAGKTLAAEPVAAEPDPEAEGGTCAGEGEMAGECGKEAGGCNKWDEAAAEVAKRDVPDGAVWKTFKVSGMHCGGCERRVVATLGELDGVVGVEADAELGQVRVASKAGEETFARASSAIGELGYKVQ